jgi:hypothetical protein
MSQSFTRGAEQSRQRAEADGAAGRGSRRSRFREALADEHDREAAIRMSGKVVVSRVKTCAGDGEVLAAHRRRAMALAEAETLLKRRSPSRRS